MTITGKLCWTALASSAAAIALGTYIGGPSAQASNQSAEVQISKTPLEKAPMREAAPAKAQKATVKAAKTQIDWQPDFATAQRVAKASDKPVMIVFGATWCGACQMLKKNTLTNTRVTEAAQKWVTVEIDTDKEPRLAAQYGIKSLPTTVFFKGDSKKFGFVGAAGPDDMLSVMQAAYARIQGAPNAQS